MNNHDHIPWDSLRAAYRPASPSLDVASIMDAVLREAAAPPARRPQANPVAAVPTWACAAAASLAILASASMLARSFGAADRHIGQAWMLSLQPDQFEENVLQADFSGNL